MVLVVGLRGGKGTGRAWLPCGGLLEVDVELVVGEGGGADGGVEFPGRAAASAGG